MLLIKDWVQLSDQAGHKVVWGPMCFAVAGLILAESSLRYPLQMIVSLGQMYGDLLYYAISLFDHYSSHVSYSRPEHYYFWVYFFS